jgi:hypothetical protein
MNNMNGKIEAIKIKQQRRQLLTNLDLFYPSPVRLDTLYRTLCHIDPTYEWPVFKKDIQYFKDKGWIRFIDDELGGSRDFDSKVTMLTAGGKEIAERTQSDPALEI